MWEYAEMSKVAKELGGPAKLADALEQVGRDQERAIWIPRTCAASVIMLGVGMIIPHIQSRYYRRWIEAEERRARARSELINCIKEYDERHPDYPEEQEDT